MDSNQIRTAVNILILVASLVTALYLATKYGFIHCSALPHWCEIYKKINTTLYGRVYPSILILYGDDGLGDPASVEKYIRDVCHYYVRRTHIKNVSLGNLQAYDVVIVERAKTLRASQLEMLWDFVAGGGKLVIIGDVGTSGPNEEFLVWKDLGEENKEGIVNVWDRKKKDGSVIMFGTQLLGLKYYGVGGSDGGYSGRVEFLKDMLTDGLPQDLSLDTNFVAAEATGSSILGPQTIAAVIKDTLSVQGAKPPYPALIRVGYRLVYMAYPPEKAGKYHMLVYFNLCRVIT